MDNALPGLVQSQRKVFDTLSIPINQILDTRSHGEFMTRYLRSTGADVDAVIFFDIDCIPLDSLGFHELVSRSIADQILVGCAQQANHLEAKKYMEWYQGLAPVLKLSEKIRWRIRRLRGKLNPPYRDPFSYAGPCFLIVPMRSYRSIGSPSLEADARNFDVAGRLSYEWLLHKKKIELLWPTACEVPKYRYGDSFGFGLGTTFQDLIYHAFESTHVPDSETPARFEQKCQELISSFKTRSLQTSGPGSIDRSTRQTR